MQWLYETVDMLMCARDPDYSNLGSERVEWLPEAAVELPDGQEMVIEPYRIAATGSVAIDPVIAGDFDDLHSVVSNIADQRLEQTMRALWAVLADVSQRTGRCAWRPSAPGSPPPRHRGLPALRRPGRTARPGRRSPRPGDRICLAGGGPGGRSGLPRRPGCRPR
jgi:hypothetical protein